MSKALSIMLASCFLVACSDESEEAATRARGDHVFAAQVRAVDKAKEVDQLIGQAAQRQRIAAEQR